MLRCVMAVLSSFGSKQDVAEALADGDGELRADIDDAIDDAVRHAKRVGEVHAEELDEGLSGLVGWTDLMEALAAISPELDGVPAESVAAAFEELAKTASDRESRQRARGRWSNPWWPFDLDQHGGRRFSFEIPLQGSIWVNDDLYPSSWELIPDAEAAEFWDEIGDHFGVHDWSEGTGSFPDGGNTGYIDNVDTTYLTIPMRSGDFDEWARDVRGEHYSIRLRDDPDGLRREFIAELPPEYRDLATLLAAEDIPDLIHLWFVDQSEEEDEGRQRVLSELAELAGSGTPDVGLDDPSRVVAEVTRDDLLRWGITTGVMWEEAPWRLVRLDVAHLPTEGRLMRHCVGNKGFGYMRAVADGDVEIWSLRSRTGKPRFTLEVDSSFYADDDDEIVPTVPLDERTDTRRLVGGSMQLRTDAIKQLKGKANRTPGYADKAESMIQFPEEVVFWRHLLQRLGVDPFFVSDFHALTQERRVQENPRRSFDAPYRP